MRFALFGAVTLAAILLVSSVASATVATGVVITTTTVPITVTTVATPVTIVFIRDTLLASTAFSTATTVVMGTDKVTATTAVGITEGTATRPTNSGLTIAIDAEQAGELLSLRIRFGVLGDQSSRKSSQEN
jgi:hypothetical protein